MTSQPSIKFVDTHYLLWKYDYNNNSGKGASEGQEEEESVIKA